MRQLAAFLVCLMVVLSTFSTAYALRGHDMIYDENGNLMKGDGFYYEYNDANQLKRVRDDNSSGRIMADYWYDPTGKRVKKVAYDSGGGNKTSYYLGNHYETEIEKNASGTFDKNTTYYHVNSEKVAKDVTRNGVTTVSYFHRDHLGSGSVITDENGSLVERTKYYPYGGTREGGEVNSYYFTGQELDRDTGLYYYGARYYHPVFATFTQADTMLPNPFDPQQLNRYAYARDNPLKYTDPTGHYLDTAVDIVSLSMSINDLRQDSGNVWNWVALGADVASLALPVAAGGGTAVRTLTKGDDVVGAATTVAKQGENTVSTINKVDNSFSSIISPTNRRGLRKAMGEPPSNMVKPQAHHDLPWNHREWFAKRGLDVNDPQYGRWVEGNPYGSHQSWSKDYDGEWLSFMDEYPDAKPEQILDKVDEIRTNTRYQ